MNILEQNCENEICMIAYVPLACLLAIIPYYTSRIVSKNKHTIGCSIKSQPSLGTCCYPIHRTFSRVRVRR